LNNRVQRTTPWVTEKAVDLGDLAEPVTRYRFENLIDHEAEALRRILAMGLHAEGFIGDE
jgi:hypothetical protein